jgi:hypothetical protein
MSHSDSSEGDHHADQGPSSSNLNEQSDNIDQSGTDFTDGSLPDEPYLFIKIYKLSLKNWYYIVLVLNLTAILLMIGSLSTNRWVKQGEDETLWEGGLTVCEKCDGDFEEEKYDDIASDVCDIDGLEGFCDQFEQLALAGTVYFALDIVSIVVVAVWSIRIVFCLFGRMIFRDILSYLLAVSSCMIHTAGFIVWIALSNAEYAASCDEVSRTEAKTLCPTHGPGLALGTISVLGVSNLIFILIFSRRKQAQVIYIQQSKKNQIN